MISVFLGNDCLEIYSTWDSNSMITDIIFGLVTILIGTAITLSIYFIDKKNKQKNITIKEE